VIKKFSYVLYLFIKSLDSIFKIIFKKSFIPSFKEFLHDDSYKSIEILNQKVNFFIPNNTVEWRVDTFFSKEPETLEWINSFNNSKEIIFWDIGANIGLYSIYTALKHSNCKVISFEPSTSNLRTLSRNISINKLENKIRIFTNPLSNKSDKFLQMNEEKFVEGGALNTFGENYDFEGKKFKSSMSYQILGKSINSIIQNKILDIPNHIKIDVDGIEHLILEGGDEYLNHPQLLSLSIEINENFTDQYQRILKIMQDYSFKILHKKHNEEVANSRDSKYNKTFNYIFIR